MTTTTTRFVDERTQAQQRTHTVLVGGRDTFMSGWGPCENGNSYAFWACRPEHRAKVETWVRSRSEFRNIRTADGAYRPQLGKNDHCHVYVVDDNHRALWNEGEQSPAELAE